MLETKTSVLRRGRTYIFLHWQGELTRILIETTLIMFNHLHDNIIS